MPTKLMHGFKALAERTCTAIRSELDLRPTDPLDCTKLADHLGVKILPITGLAKYGAKSKSIAHLLSPESGFSALTVCRGDRRLIVHNPNHPTGRRTNSLAHELAHIILEHEASSNPFEGGCRVWDARQEEEADWLAAAMLVPREGALAWLKRGADMSSGAEHFGVSEALFNWRANQTGVAYQLQRGKLYSAQR